MDAFLSRYKNILVLVSVLVAQIVGLAAQIRRPNPNGPDLSSVRLIRYWAVSLVAPPEKVLHGTGGGIRGLWSSYLDLRHVRQQNRELKDEISRYQLEQAALLEDARQGQRLQKLLSFREHYIYSTVPAEVIGTSGTDRSRLLYINKGTKDGLKPDMAVITPDGIVGKLKDVFANTSQVLEISDQTSGAGVLLESTRLRGVLRGNAVGQPQIINLLPDDRVKPGERVITSGGDQIYPRGLPVGVVDYVAADTQNPPYVDVVIKPAANLGRLEEVLIITQVSSAMPPKEQQDLAQSALAAQAAGTQRASDVLSQRLPGLDPPAASKNGAAVKDDGPDNAPPVKPLPAIHADRFTPNATPPASELTPGKEISGAVIAPLPVTKPQPAATAENPVGAAASKPAAKSANAKKTQPVKHLTPVAPADAPSAEGGR